MHSTTFAESIHYPKKKYEASPCEFIDTENWLWDDITSGV